MSSKEPLKCEWLRVVGISQHCNLYQCVSFFLRFSCCRLAPGGKMWSANVLKVTSNLCCSFTPTLMGVPSTQKMPRDSTATTHTLTRRPSMEMCQVQLAPGFFSASCLSVYILPCETLAAIFSKGTIVLLFERTIMEQVKLSVDNVYFSLSQSIISVIGLFCRFSLFYSFLALITSCRLILAVVFTLVLFDLFYI